jgi:hypothetical protein
MHTHGQTIVWGTPVGVGRATGEKGWSQQLKAWWVARRAARQQATRAALHRRWHAERERVLPCRADAAPEMAAAHHGIAVATLLYGLNQ